jgi:hypothetical protein
MLQAYEGGCHCGRVRFRIRADLDPTAIGECNCSICTKKGILHITVAPGNFELLRGEGEMTTYRFNTGTAQHNFYRTCASGRRPSPRACGSAPPDARFSKATAEATGVFGHHEGGILAASPHPIISQGSQASLGKAEEQAMNATTSPTSTTACPRC